MYPDPVTEAELRPSVTNAGAVWWGPGARGPLTSGEPGGAIFTVPVSSVSGETRSH